MNVTRPSCPVLPLKDFEECPIEELDTLLEAIGYGQPGVYARGTYTVDGRIDMCKQSIGPQGAKRIAHVLQEQSEIHTVLLGTDGIGDEGAQSVAEMARKHPSIETIYLGCNGITAKGVQSLSAAVHENKRITGLWLKRNPIGEEGADILAHYLSKGSNLEVLDLVHTGIGLSGLKKIIEAVISGKVPITHLYLGANAFDESIINVLLPYLSVSTSIKGLYLSGNFIGDSGIKELFSKRFSLKELGIGSNGLTDKSIETICQGTHLDLTRLLDLGRTPAQTTLGAQANDFGDEGTSQLANKLMCFPALEILNLKQCGIQKRGCTALVSAAMHHSCLCSVNLSGNVIDAHAKRLLDVFHKNRTKRVSPIIQRIKSRYR